MAQAIRNLMKRPVVLHSDCTVVQAARAMKENDIGSVLVCDEDRHIVGICTDRDIALAIGNGGLEFSAPITDVMSNEVYAVGEGFTTSDVTDVMARFGVRRIPVLKSMSGGRERCVGIVTLDDVIESGEVEPEKLRLIVRQQVAEAARSKRRSPLANAERAISRQEQSYQRFIHAVREETGLPENGAGRFTRIVMSGILKRIPESEGRKLLAQFPRRLQLELIPMVSRSDRSVDANLLLSETAVRFSMDSEQAEQCLYGFFRAISRLISSGATRQLCNSLPKDLQRLFSGDYISPKKGALAEVTPIAGGGREGYVTDDTALKEDWREGREMESSRKARQRRDEKAERRERGETIPDQEIPEGRDPGRTAKLRVIDTGEGVLDPRGADIAETARPASTRTGAAAQHPGTGEPQRGKSASRG